MLIVAVTGYGQAHDKDASARAGSMHISPAKPADSAALAKAPQATWGGPHRSWNERHISVTAPSASVIRLQHTYHNHPIFNDLYLEWTQGRVRGQKM